MSEVEHLITVQDEVGETPIWIPNEQAMYWIDLEGSAVHRYDPSTGDRKDWSLDAAVTALARRASGGWILATKTGLAFWDQAGATTEFIADPTADSEAIRFNDTTVDQQGRLIVGTANVQDFEASDGALYRLDPDLSLQQIDDGYAISNGMGFSPDGKILYVTDMFHNRIVALDYDIETGAVGNKRTFVEVPGDTGLPDGLTVDAEGFVWSAHWAGSRVTRYDPDGVIERQIPVPATNATSLGFGGADMNELYITTAWFFMSEEDRKAQPQAGDVFRVKTDVTGIVEQQFAG
ncbi:MAG: SMP-30/gluconolactonase/LRE family protein [Phycisphaerae bacterium]|jgi:sugar lactone lactonase YvrE|nr:SMP-30/gluconolactonase/LRE family protein [Phycisphaerae bacterium]MDP7288448.1 SMP-30/gluconolactonase/LRE family protein [Phycisphaerae bacterium]